MKGLRTISTVGGAALVALCWAGSAAAVITGHDDAGWYASGQDRSLIAEWRFDSDPGSNTEVADSWAWRSGPGEPLLGGGSMSPDVEYTNLTYNTGGWTGGTVDDPAAGSMRFWLPNFIDEMPIKHVRVQVEFNETANPKEFWGVNPDGVWGYSDLPGHGCYFDSGTASGGCAGDFVGGYFEGDETKVWYSQDNWKIEPNPYAEYIDMEIPKDVWIDRVVIETISTVPVPPAVWLLGSALLGLLAVGRRRGPAAQC